jgi:hypothetical protein
MASKGLKLIKAASRGDIRAVDSLIGKGADVNAVDEDGSSALLSTVSGLSFFKKQVIRGRIVKWRPTPLEAIKKTVRLLLKAGANPNVIGEYGTPLLSAAGSDCLPVVRMLVEAGADPNLQNDWGHSPLASAVLCGRAKIVAYLLEVGADPRLEDVDGRSVLGHAKFALQRGREYRPIYQMIKATYAKLPKNSRVKPATTSLPSELGVKDFASMKGHPEWSLFAVKAPAAAVTRALADFLSASRVERQVSLKPAKAFEQVLPLTAVVRTKKNPWTVVLRSIFSVSAEELESVPKEARALSSKFKTRSITFFLEDTSSAMSYAIYDRGRLLEEAEWDGMMLAFKSTLREKPTEKRFTLEFADQVFQQQGVYVPACYPCSRNGRISLSVQKVSSGRIETADLLEFGKLPTPTFDKVMRRLKNRITASARAPKVKQF